MAYVEFWCTSNSGQTAQRAKIRVYYTVTQSGNTSTITATNLSVFMNTTSGYGYDGKTFYLDGKITFNGTAVYTSSSANANSNCGKVVTKDNNVECWVQNHLPSGSITVTHNSSGVGSFTAAMTANRFSAFFGVNDSYTAYQFKGTGNKSVSLPTIEQKYTITYNANGGSGSQTSTTVNKGSSFSLPTCTFTAPAATSTNYTVTLNGNGGLTPCPRQFVRKGTKSFNGWSTSSSATSGTAAGTSVTPSSNTTYYATWKTTWSGAFYLGTTSRPDTVAAGYKVTFDANGGTCSTSSLTSKIITSYAFNNWNSAADGTGTSYASDVSYGGNGNYTFYAQWTPTAANQKVLLPIPTRAGYKFKGWGTSKTATTTYVQSYIPSKAITLYAIWEPIGTVPICIDGVYVNTIPHVYVTESDPYYSSDKGEGWYMTTPYIFDTNGSHIVNKSTLIDRNNFMYTYSGSSSFSGNPNGNWTLILKTSGTLTIHNLPTNIDIHVVGGGGSGGIGYYACGGGGGFTTTKKNYNPTSLTLYCQVGEGGGITSVSDFTATDGVTGTASYVKLNSSSGTTVVTANGGVGGGGGTSDDKGGNGGSGGGYWGQAGGTNGGNGGGSSNSQYGTGQGTTTRDFGDTSGTLRSGGGSGQDNGTAAEGGGGAGGTSTAAWGNSGTPQYGGGGGGGRRGCGRGGSGIIIIRNTQ